MDKKVINTIIDHRAETQGDRVAIESGGLQTTYAQLRQAYEAVAYCLMDMEVSKSQVIAVYLPSSMEYISAIIGINKAACIFLPLSDQYPDARLFGVLVKALPEIFITSEPGRDKLLQVLGENYPVEHLSFIIIADQLKEISVEDYCDGSLVIRNKIKPTAGIVLPVVDGNDSNYLIYTSGSTGEPKMIEGMHKSLSHFIHWEMGEFNCNQQTKVSQLAPVSFDVSFRDIFMPLVAGGTVCIPAPGIKLNAAHLLAWIKESGITLMHMVPTLFRNLLQQLEEQTGSAEYLSTVKHILLAGEALLTDDVNRWRKLGIPHIELVNLYGPSETTLAKLFNRLGDKSYVPGGIVPLGNPISNTSVLILNRSNMICNIGEIGEIHIRSPFITKGYYNNPALTKEKFIQNPLQWESVDIIYKTGDLGKYLEDGKIGFAGRMDGQVKIRGNRVEMAEVELTIKQFESIDHCVVVPLTRTNGELSLTCYYTSKKQFAEQELGGYLKERLPDYMLPSYFVSLAAFPLNINGKIDKAALPAPEEILYEKMEFRDPVNDTQTVLVSIWKDVLGLKKVGTRNSFFELGGHSLSATKVISQVYRQLGKEITLKDFFSNPTVEGLGKLLGQKSSNVFQPIKPLPGQLYYDISYSQKRLWILHHTQARKSIHNIPLAGTLSGSIDVQALKKAIEMIVARHESLRTTFLFTNGEIKQQINPADFTIREYDETNALFNDDVLIQQYIDKMVAYEFHLQQGPLITAELVHLPSGRYLLLINMHHIISDGWSVGVFIHELTILYQACSLNLPDPLPSLAVHYKDYVEWQNALLETSSARNKQYWHRECSGVLPQINLPFDFPRPQHKTFIGKKRRFALSKEASAFLRKLAVETGSGLFVTMLSVIYSLLHGYSGQKDIVLGTPVSGRNHEQLEDQIGFYLNYLVLRLNINGDEQVQELLKSIQRKVLDAFEHQDYPYDQLVDDLVREQPVNRNPFYDVLVIMNNDGLNGRKEDFDSLENIVGLKGIAVEDHLSKLDITFFIADLEQIVFTIEYSTDLFKTHTIGKMENDIHHLVHGMMQGAATVAELISGLTDEVPLAMQEDSFDMIDERF